MLANPVLHIYAGALITKTWGFGFNQLRVWALVLAIIAAWVASKCANVCGLRFWGSLLVGVLVLINPINMNLSYTFMTDGPFICFSALSGLFFLRAIKFDTGRDVLAGSFFAGVAYTVRQFGVLLVLAYVATELCRYMVRRQSFPWLRLLLSCIPTTVIFVFSAYVSRNRLTGTSLPFELDFLSWFPQTGYLLVVALSYLALFCIPILAVVAIERLSARRKERHRFLITLLVILCVLLPFFFWNGWQRLPTFLPNMIYDLGIGPITMFHGDDPWQGPLHIGRLWWPVTGVWMMAGTLVVLLMLESLRASFARQDVAGPDAALDLFLVLWASAIIIGLANPWTLAHVNIRYIMPALIPISVLCARKAPSLTRKSSACAAFVLAALIAFISVVCVQDYLAWSRARWEAVARLENELDVPMDKISAGFEVNGWFLSQRFMEVYNTRDFSFRGPYGFCALDDTYIVTLGETRDEYVPVFDVPYFSWLGMATRNIKVLKRSPSLAQSN